MERPGRMHWRFYRTAGGASPVEDYLRRVPSLDRAAIAAAMLEARTEGLRMARHLDGDLYELRVAGVQAHYRLLLSQEAKFVLLAVDAYQKASQKLPPHILRRAQRRLADWRARGRALDR